MPVWPKSFYTFGIGLKTAGTEWKLRHKRSAPGAQTAALRALLPRLAAASHWHAAGIEATLDYAKFQARVPLHSPGQLTPQIDRMRKGEANVLWPGTCALFALSSGTTTGQPRNFPVTEEMLVHFRNAVTDALLYYTVRVKHAGVFRGRHLILGGSTELLAAGEGDSHEAFAADLGGILEVNLPGWAERHLYEPGPSVARIPDWEARLEAITARAGSRDVSLLAGLPNWVLVLAARLLDRARAAGRPIPHLQALWPNLECLLHTGLPVGPFANELRAALGPDVKFQEVYAAAEGFIATQDKSHASEGLRVMADQGIFFEFLPMAHYDEARLAQLGGRAVPLEGVKLGIDYAVVVTTPAGLARTLIGDVVRFVSTTPPRLLYVGRTDFQLNAFGERVSEKDATDSLATVCRCNQWDVVNFHVAPQFQEASLTGVLRGVHEWWIELRPWTVVTPKGPRIAQLVDTELQRLNSEYAARRSSGQIALPVVRLVMPGVFEHWLRFVGRWGGLHRQPRCCSDRRIADQLADVTRFSH